MAAQNDSEYERTVRYYYVAQKPGKGSHSSDVGFKAPENWQDAMLEFSKASFKERWVDGVIYELRESPNGVVVGMHKPLDSKFITQIDSEGGSIFDYANAENHQNLLANATAVAMTLINERLVVGVAQSNGLLSPSHKGVERLCQHVLPSAAGYRWETYGIIEGPQVDELLQAGSITMFEGGFKAQPGMHPALAGPDIQRIANEFANVVGYEVDLQVKINIRGVTDTQNAQRNLWGMAKDAMGYLSGSTKRKAKVHSQDGTKVLDLAEHNFASPVYLSVNDKIGINFSSLIEQVDAELAAQAPRIQEILST